ncbi:MAG: hypothetical protein WB493_13310 [Anaeromyxobacteraceae bacterium]
MHVIRTAALAVAVLSLAAPVLAQEAPFVSTGEVVYRNSAAFDATRVRGPTVNMAVTKDGRWGGSILQKDVMLKVTPDRISGAGVNLVVKRAGGTLTVEGLVNNVRVRLEGSANKFVGRVGTQQVESTKEPGSDWWLNAGSGRQATIRFKGDAGKMPDVPMPQWVFAVIGAI